jgi:copper chaperone CopZ
MKKLIKIEGMNCQHCVAAVKKNLAILKLKNYEVNIGTAEIEYDESEVTEKTIQESIEDAGYKVVNTEKIS